MCMDVAIQSVNDLDLFVLRIVSRYLNSQEWHHFVYPNYRLLALMFLPIVCDCLALFEELVNKK